MQEHGINPTGAGQREDGQLQDLTRKQLLELEREKKTKLQPVAGSSDLAFALSRRFGFHIGIYADPRQQLKPESGYLSGIFVYFDRGLWNLLCGVACGSDPGETGILSISSGTALRYLRRLFLLFAFYDYLTLKTGILTQPFVPCLNFVINAAWTDRAMLLDCTIHTLGLLFLGYFIGVAVGLVTGITCGYSSRCRYWVDPIIKFLGPIPTSTWIPIMMVVASSLFQGAMFIIALGSWFAVTVASMTGISNVDPEYFEAARTLGASDRQLVFRVAIPRAMPSIFQGCTQAMSSSCTAIMIAEMLGVKSGLGWYMNWSKSWASYDKMFAALFVICFIFTVVTKTLEAVKRRVLRWQVGVEK